ncbi:MAG: hypothetical protein JWO32_1210 [Bacteroidetes bacterium]|nr:hypothetical protein [Bacteroidota bacterium]
MKIKWILIFLLLFGILGYFREFFFVHLNNIMYIKYYRHPTALNVPFVMQPFTSFSYQTLYYSKYFFTVLSVVLFFFSAYFAIIKLTSNKKLVRFLIYSYGLLLILAAISMAYGFVFNQRLQDDEYTLSRWLLGIAQSPIICLILLASENLFNKSVQTHHKN